MAKKKVDKIDAHVEIMCKEIASFLDAKYPETVTIKKGRKKNSEFQPYIQLIKSFYVWQDLEREKILNGIWKINEEEKN